MIVIELNIVIEGGKRELPCQEVDRQLQMFEDNLIPRLPQPPPVVNQFDGLCQILIMATPPEGNRMLSLLHRYDPRGAARLWRGEPLAG